MPNTKLYSRTKFISNVALYDTLENRRNAVELYLEIFDFRKNSKIKSVTLWKRGMGILKLNVYILFLTYKFVSDKR